MVERSALSLAERAVERLGEVVLPAPRRRGEAPLELLGVVGGNAARLRAHGDEHAHQRRLRQQHRELRPGAAEGVDEDRLPLAPQLRRVALARRVDQARDEALVQVVAQEHAEALPPLELENAEHGAREVALAHLEELVARIGGEDVGERLRGVALRREARLLQHAPDLAAQQRDVGRLRAVRHRRVQAEEAVLAAHVASRVVALDADVVEVTRPVHGRARVRLGDDDEIPRLRLAAQCRGKLPEACRVRLAGTVAQDAEPRAWHDREPDAFFPLDEIVAAVADVGEVGVREPRQEFARLGNVVGGQRRRVALQIRHHLEHLRAHRRPVADDGADVGEHAREVGGQRTAPRRVCDSLDLDVHQRLAHAAALAVPREPGEPAACVPLHRHDRVRDQVHGQSLPQHLHLHGVDEERHVVVDDLDDRVRRLPALLVDRGVEHPHLRFAGCPRRGDLPERPDRTVEIERLALDHVLGIEPREVGPAQLLEVRALARIGACGDERKHGLDAFRGGGIMIGGHQDSRKMSSKPLRVRFVQPRGQPSRRCARQHQW